MNTFYRIVLTVAMLAFYAASWADPVPLPCEPKCTINPCDLAPERCKDKGGPLSQKAAPATEDMKDTKAQKSDDSCKWCEPCSRTPGSQCLKCCAGHSKTSPGELMR